MATTKRHKPSSVWRKKTPHEGPPVPRGEGGRWLPGQSANPGGRLASNPEVMRIFHEASPQAAQAIVDMALGVIEVGQDVRLRAAQEIVNRTHGRPRQDVEISGVEGTGLGTKVIVEHVHISRTAE